MYARALIFIYLFILSNEHCVRVTEEHCFKQLCSALLASVFVLFFFWGGGEGGSGYCVNTDMHVRINCNLRFGLISLK